MSLHCHRWQGPLLPPCLNHPFPHNLALTALKLDDGKEKKFSPAPLRSRIERGTGSCGCQELSISGALPAPGWGSAPADPCTTPLPLPWAARADGSWEEKLPQCARWDSSRGRGGKGKGEPRAHFPFQCSQSRRALEKPLLPPDPAGQDRAW